MIINRLKRFSLPLSLLPLTASQCTLADFADDLSATAIIKNYYFNRDFRDGPGQSMGEEWAQGFQLNLSSGFTQGTVGFGVDGIAMLGLKLSGGPDGPGVGLLSRDANGSAHDEYSKFMLTGKVRMAKSDLRVGAISPALPMLSSNTSRLFPQVFNGALLVSNDFDNITLNLGRVDQVTQRDSTNFEKLTVSTMLGSYPSDAKSDSYTFGGADYNVSNHLQLSAHFANFEDFYHRGFLGLKANYPLWQGSVFSEVRAFKARQSGSEKLGQVDNTALSSIMGYSWLGHQLSASYQRIAGDTAYAYLGGSNTYLFSESQLSVFGYKNERSWHVRYGYDFAALGLPGLTFAVRYIHGDKIDSSSLSGAQAAALSAAGVSGKEWESSTDFAYVVQSGPIKDLVMRWVHSNNRANFTRSADEHRVMLSYTVNF